MLKKTHRLTRRQFDEYFKTGRRIHTPHFTVIHQPDDVFHGAAVVGKKVYKSAVARNRLRRQLYGVLYRWYKQTELTGVFMVIAKPGVKELTQREIAPQLQTALNRIA